MDCGTLLSFRSEAEIRAATRECLEAGMEGSPGGHVFCANNAITASVPLANYLAMVGEYRKFFGLPELRLREVRS
jgi:uroporphyrinogen-III decarboxylase